MIRKPPFPNDSFIEEIAADIDQNCRFLFVELDSFVEENEEQQSESQPTDGFPLKCHICSKVFPRQATLSQLLTHQHKEVEKPFACSLCPVESYRNCQDLSHIGKIECKNCSAKFASEENLATHIQVNCQKTKAPVGVNYSATTTQLDPQDSEYQCTICHQKFESKNDENEHEVTHGNKFFCGFCTVGFETLQGLKQHQIYTHPEPIRTRILKCSFCQKIFSSQEAFRTHRSNCTGIKVKSVHEGQAGSNEVEVKYDIPLDPLTLPVSYDQLVPMLQKSQLLMHSASQINNLSTEKNSTSFADSEEPEDAGLEEEIDIKYEIPFPPDPLMDIDSMDSNNSNLVLSDSETCDQISSSIPSVTNPSDCSPELITAKRSFSASGNKPENKVVEKDSLIVDELNETGRKYLPSIIGIPSEVLNAEQFVNYIWDTNLVNLVEEPVALEIEKEVANLLSLPLHYNGPEATEFATEGKVKWECTGQKSKNGCEKNDREEINEKNKGQGSDPILCGVKSVTNNTIDQPDLEYYASDIIPTTVLELEHYLSRF